MTNRYIKLIIIYLCYFTICSSQFKIPPLMGIIGESLNISISQVSWLISICTLAGVFLTIPGAAIMNMIGPKRLLLSLLTALCVGNLTGFITKSFTALLLSRAIEGIAIAMIPVVSLVLINLWFDDGGKGIAIGIFNGSGAISLFVIMNIAIPIVRSFGLKSLWLLFAIFSIILYILVLFFIETPDPKKTASIKKPISFFEEVVKNSKVWILSLIMICNVFSLRAYTTTYPLLFGSYYNIDLMKANFYASLNGLFGIIACTSCGIIVDKVKKPIFICLVGFTGLALIGYIIDLLGPSTYMLHSIASAILPGYILISIDIIVPTISHKPQFIGYTYSLIRLSYFLGAFASTPVILETVAIYGWSTAKYIMVAVGLAGAVFSILLMAMTREKNKTFRF